MYYFDQPGSVPPVWGTPAPSWPPLPLPPVGGPPTLPPVGIPPLVPIRPGDTKPHPPMFPFPHTGGQHPGMPVGAVHGHAPRQRPHGYRSSNPQLHALLTFLGR